MVCIWNQSINPQINVVEYWDINSDADAEAIAELNSTICVPVVSNVIVFVAVKYLLK